MRRILLATTILAGPMMAAATAAAQTCSLDALTALTTLTAPATAPAPALAPAVAAAASMAWIGETEIRSNQVLRRLASRGAKLVDLGTVRGLRGVLAQAQTGSAPTAVQIFYLLPDGQAAIAGQLWDVGNPDRNAWDVTTKQVSAIMPAAQGQGRGPILEAGREAVPALTGAADTVRPVSAAELASNTLLAKLVTGGAALADLGADHGVRAVFAWTATAFQTYYVTPDGEAVVAGVLWNLAEPEPSRRNVTLRQTRSILGVVPTVAIGPQAAAAMPRQAGIEAAAGRAPQASQSSQEVDGLALLAGAHAGLVGQDGAPRVHMIIDPMCGFSVRAMEELRPAIAAGQIQVALVPVAGLDSHNGGQSTPAARALLTADPASMGDAWRTIVDAARRREPNGLPINDQSAAEVAANNEVAGRLGVQSLPVLIWRRPDGTAGTYVGSGGLRQVLSSVAR